MRPSATVSIVVPVYNGGAPFKKCLDSIANLYPKADEVVIVADGDSDRSWKQAESYGFKIVKRSITGGPAKARNFGANTATGNIIFFIDADVTLPSHAIGEIKTLFSSHNDFEAIIGSYDDLPSETNFLSQYKNLFHHFVHQNGNEKASTFWGACGAIRRETFIGIGGFNESYRWPSIEDIELGYRLKEKGHRIRLIKSLQVKHLKRWEFFSLLKTEIFHRAVPWSDLIIRTGNFIDDLNISFKNRLNVVLIFLLMTTIGLGIIHNVFLTPLLIILPLLIGLNLDLYSFFYENRGAVFVLKAISWHWFYLFYSGLVFFSLFFKYKVLNSNPTSKC